MRWPFSLLFRGEPAAPAAGPAAGTGAPGSSPAAASAGGVPARPAAWRGLPAVQRTMGEAPLTAPALPFGRALAGRRPADLALRPLAHDVAADGPAGLVSGIATPLTTAPPSTPARAGHAPQPARPAVQRRAASSAAAPPPRAERPAVDDDVASAAEPWTPDAPRSLPAVPPAAAATALAATRVASGSAPFPPLATATPTGPAAERRAAAAADAAASGAPAAATPAGGPGSAHLGGPPFPPLAVGAAPLDGGAEPPLLQRRSLGESRFRSFYCFIGFIH